MKYMNCLICMLMIFAGWGCSDDTIQENKEPMVATDGGYLFAHMTDENYARLFYSVSRDAFHWETLNKSESCCRTIAAIRIFARGKTVSFI